MKITTSPSPTGVTTPSAETIATSVLFDTNVTSSFCASGILYGSASLIVTEVSPVIKGGFVTVDVVVPVVPVFVVVEEAGFDVEDVLLTEVVIELLDVDEVVLVVVVDVVEELVVVVGEMRVVIVVDVVVTVVVSLVVVVSGITTILNGFSALPKYAVFLPQEAST